MDHYQTRSGLGRRTYNGRFLHELHREGFKELPVSWIHSSNVLNLPLIHRDPFDRMLIAQAMSENLVLLSSNTILKQYPVTIL